jgi:hypothetical protein
VEERNGGWDLCSKMNELSIGKESASACFLQEPKFSGFKACVCLTSTLLYKDVHVIQCIGCPLIALRLHGLM